jgi:tetratricopeptide (TPR) repeat protein
LALLGERVKKGKLISFEKMHPSIALLPSAEDAATAFAEVFFAVDLVYRERGAAGLRAIIENLAGGAEEKKAVEVATERSFPAFEKAWMAHMKKQPFPKEFIPLSDQKVVLKEQSAPGKKESPRKGKEINFSDFAEVEETGARKMAHLGELMRERGHALAAADEYGKARSVVGDKYESISNKYALALLELRRVDEAEQVLQGALRLHPGSPTTNIHLGRIYLFKKQFQRARAAYRSALASDPFDEEIHLSLVRIETALGAKELAQRARSAAMALTGLPTEMVDRVATSLGRNDRELSEASIPAHSEEREAEELTARAVESPDAGNL